MKITQQFFLSIMSMLVLASTYSCQQAGGEQTGSELIPDMGHSIAYEANVSSKYDLNSWDDQSVKSYRELIQPRLPVNGTIPRGFSSVGVSDETFATAEEAVAYTVNRMKGDNGISYQPNGSVPYYFPDTEDGRQLATQQLRFNPFPITQDGIARGQELFNLYCAICHGDKGDGGGHLVEGPTAKYPAQPANFLLDDLINSSNGRYYHAIVYGKNAMGAHADKLSYEERWQVIHYIRTLQAKEKKVEYSSTSNTLNPEFGVPQAQVPTKPIENAVGHLDEVEGEQPAHEIH